ncbi:unnamed protein product [Linum tenue]|uniref:BHLH domain-containing protein n=1 Tax=Linum tenue TaxID=586396 RepID=A0AAV0PBS2_9ROSI|nr:unnamed protein product [Linum tenue]
MEFVATTMNELCTEQQVCSRKRAPELRYSDDETKGYKSKNLIAERKRRQKLTDRLLMLRASVPIITNASLQSLCLPKDSQFRISSPINFSGFGWFLQMNKATIIDDAITYIQELMRNVEVLSDQLDALSAEEAAEGSESPATVSAEIKNEDAAAGVDPEEMKTCGIQEEVEVMQIEGKKLWVKIVMGKKRGRFTKLIEGMTKLGLQLTHTSLTTSKGAFLVSSCVEVVCEEMAMVHQIKELLIQIMKGI